MAAPDPIMQAADHVEMDEETEDAILEEEQNDMFIDNLSAQLP